MKKILLLITIFILTLSCSDFLDEKPSNQGDSGNFIGNAADAKVILNGIMRKMTSQAYYGRNMFLYADAKGGDLTIGARGRGFDDMYVFSHSATNSSYAGFWFQIYNCILEANNLIINIDKLISKGNKETKLKEYKGQALTLRAMFYYDLVRLYGKPYDMDKASYGVPLTLAPLESSALPKRESVENIYKQILSDLKESEPIIPKSIIKGNINYYGNKAMQARVYLQMQNYDEALKAAEEIIESGKYKPYSNEEWVASWGKQFGSESIFELIILSSESDLGQMSLGSMTINADKYKETKWDYFIASDYFLERLAEDKQDVRWGIMGEDEKSTSKNIRKGCCYKYVGGITAQGDGEGKETTTAVNIKIIRLSEIYLIAAEAALTINKEKSAKYLNEIRKRAPNLPAATANNVDIDMIMNEKSKELLTEGCRFFDMMRLNKSITFDDKQVGSEVISREKTIDRTFYKTRLPIDIDEIHANPEIKNQQNPGY